MISTLSNLGLDLRQAHIGSNRDYWLDLMALKSPLIRPSLEDRTQFADLQGTSAFHEVERELRYFLSLEKLQKFANLPGLHFKVITQHSIPKEDYAAVRKLISPDAAALLFDSILAKRARIRHLHSGNQDLFYLQTKSAKREINGHKIERSEPTVRISAELFYKLRPIATYGSLAKLRAVARGEISSMNKADRAVELHVDLLLAAGKMDSRGSIPLINPKDLPGSITELEFSRRECLPKLLQGEHTFAELLRDCPIVSKASKEIRKAVSTSRIARDGYDRQAREAMLALSRL
jgi:hypothetical protein